VGTKSLGWWTFKWGANKNSLVTDAAITPMLERLNQEFAYFRDTMGWLPTNVSRTDIEVPFTFTAPVSVPIMLPIPNWEDGKAALKATLSFLLPIIRYTVLIPHVHIETEKSR
jgi:hypothetical protein